MPRDPDQKLRRHPEHGCFFLFREIAAASSVKTALHSTIRHIHLLSEAQSAEEPEEKSRKRFLLISAPLQLLQQPEQFPLLLLRERTEQGLKIITSLILQLAGAGTSFFRQGDQRRPPV